MAGTLLFVRIGSGVGSEVERVILDRVMEVLDALRGAGLVSDLGDLYRDGKALDLGRFGLFGAQRRERAMSFFGGAAVVWHVLTRLQRADRRGCPMGSWVDRTNTDLLSYKK